MVLKYVIFDNAFIAMTPVNSGVQHADLSISDGFGTDMKPTSAGFVSITRDSTVKTYGESVSLGLKARKADAAIIERAL